MTNRTLWVRRVGRFYRLLLNRKNRYLAARIKDPTDEKAWADYWKGQYELLANRVDEAQAVLGGFRDDD